MGLGKSEKVDLGHGAQVVAGQIMVALVEIPQPEVVLEMVLMAVCVFHKEGYEMEWEACDHMWMQYKGIGYHQW